MGAVEQGTDIENRRLQNQRMQQQMQITGSDEASLADQGNALRLLYGGGGGQGPSPPAPGPGTPSMPAGGPTGGGPTAPVAAGPGTTPPSFSGGLPGRALPGGFNPAPMSGQPAPLSGGQQPVAGQSQPPAPSAPAPAPASSPPPTGGGGDAGGAPRASRDSIIPPGSFKGGGPMTLQQLIQAVKQGNPGISPQRLMRAVNGLTPLLKQEEMVQWRESQNEIKRIDQQRKADQFEAKEYRLRWEGAEKLRQKDEQITNAKVNNADKLTLANLEHERKVIKDQNDHDVKILDMERKREFGEEKIGAEDRRTESQERIAGEKAATTRAVTTEKIEGASALEGKKQEGRTALEGTKQEGRAALETQRQEGRMELTGEKGRQNIEKLNISNDFKERLHKADNDTKIDIAAMHDANKFDLANASNAFKKWYADQTITAKRELQEYVEGKRDVRAAAGRESKEGIAAAGRESAKERADARNALIAQSIAVREKAFEERRARLSPTLQDHLKRSEAEGFDTDSVAREAQYKIDTGEYSPHLKALTGANRTAAVVAVEKYTSEELRPTAQQLENNKRLYANSGKIINAFTDPNKPTGQAIRGMSVLQNHLTTYKEALNAWNPSDNRFSNRIASYLNKEFGGTAATNLDALSHVIGIELLRSLGVKGAGTGSERQEYSAALSSAPSPEAKSLLSLASSLAHGPGGITLEQGMGIVGQYQKLIDGQLQGYRKQWEGTLLPASMFDAMLTDTAKEEMQRIKEGKPTLRPSPLSRTKTFGTEIQQPGPNIAPRMNPPSTWRAPNIAPPGFGGPME